MPGSLPLPDAASPDLEARRRSTAFATLPQPPPVASAAPRPSATLMMAPPPPPTRRPTTATAPAPNPFESVQPAAPAARPSFVAETIFPAQTEEVFEVQPVQEATSFRRQLSPSLAAGPPPPPPSRAVSNGSLIAPRSP